MGLFDALESLTKAAVNTALTPVEVVKDVATLGGALNGKREPYTVTRLKRVAKNLDEFDDEL